MHVCTCVSMHVVMVRFHTTSTFVDCSTTIECTFNAMQFMKKAGLYVLQSHPLHGTLTKTLIAQDAI